MGKLKAMERTVKKFGVRMTAKKLKTVFKKKKPNEDRMEIDEVQAEKLVAKAKMAKKQTKSNKAADFLPPAPEKPKREQKVVEGRVRANALPLHVNPKATNLKNAKPSVYSNTTVFPTRRMSKKQLRKIMNAKRRDEKAADRAERAMDMD